MLSEAQILQPHLSGQLSDSGLGRSPQEDFQRLLSQAASPHRRQQQQYQPDRQSSQHDSALADLNLGKSRSGQTQSDAVVAPPAPPSRQAPDTSPAQKENKIAPAKRKQAQSQPQPGVKGNAPSQTQQNAPEMATGPAWGAPEQQRAQSLAGVQQEQQQQHDLSWDIPAPEPAMSKPAEPKAAPWAGVKPPLPAGGESLCVTTVPAAVPAVLLLLCCCCCDVLLSALLCYCCSAEVTKTEQPFCPLHLTKMGKGLQPDSSHYSRTMVTSAMALFFGCKPLAHVCRAER